MIRYVFGVIAAALFALTAAPAHASTFFLHRFQIHNQTAHCLSATAQMKGPYRAQSLPSASPGATIDRILEFDAKTPEWFIEYDVYACGSPGKILYRGWHVNKTTYPTSTLVVAPRGSGFVMTGN